MSAAKAWSELPSRPGPATQSPAAGLDRDRAARGTASSSPRGRILPRDTGSH